jgi:hypothetical protein
LGGIEDTMMNGDRGTIYEIKIRGQLDQHWSAWFDGLMMTYDEQGHTIEVAI